MKLDEILPRREWVTLTEAATAIAFGRSETAADFAKRRTNTYECEIEKYKEEARAAHRSAKEAGWANDWLDNPPDPSSTPYPDVVSRFLGAWPSKDGQLADQIYAYQDAVKTIITAAARGELDIVGAFISEDQRHEPIPTFELNNLHYSEEDETDAIRVLHTKKIWKSIMIRRGAIIKSDYISNNEISNHEPDNIKFKDSPVKKSTYDQDIENAILYLWPDNNLPSKPGVLISCIQKRLKDIKSPKIPSEQTVRRYLKHRAAWQGKS